MLPGRLARMLATSVTTAIAVATTWLLAAPAAAQKPLPPSHDNGDLTAARPWTYLMAWALLAGAVLLIGLAVLGYLIKSREFRANQRRGGAK